MDTPYSGMIISTQRTSSVLCLSPQKFRKFGKFDPGPAARRWSGNAAARLVRAPRTSPCQITMGEGQASRPGIVVNVSCGGTMSPKGCGRQHSDEARSQLGAHRPILVSSGSTVW